MRLVPALLPLLALALAGCSRSVTPEPKAVSDRIPDSPSTAGAPAAKEVIAFVLGNTDLRLDRDSSCAGVGTSRGDISIGDFLAGFLAEQTNHESGRNWIDTSCKHVPDGDAAAGWECQMLVRRVDGEERWGWGVRFRVQDRKPVRASFRCIGAG